MKLTFIKRGNIAVPIDENWNKLKEEEVFTAEVRRIRCPGFHRKYWSMVRLAYENDPCSEKFPTIEKYNKFLLILGGYNYVVDTKEVTYFEAESISYESMDQDEFNKVYNTILTVIVKRLGLTNEELINEILDYV